jgi:outer membrane protein
MRQGIRIAAIAGLVAAQWAGSAVAQDSPWLLRFGVTQVAPKSNNSSVVNVDDGTSLTINATYFFKPNWGFEILAALPFEHDIALVAGTPVGDTKHLPPTFSIEYYFAPEAKVRPYVGVGLNYTVFMSEHLTGPLAGADLELDDSTGLAYQAGIDFPLNDRWLINLDVRSIDIESDANLNGAFLTKVKIDPKTFGVNVGYRF